MVWLPAHRRTAGDLAVRSLDKVSPGSDQLYSWGGAEGPKAPPHLPNGGGLGRRSRPKPPPKSVKFARTMSKKGNRRTMYTLTNESLEVSILDPLADQERFGTRYCTGGYIFQIEDRRHGALLSGPTYPDSFNWFDGQGIPDAFNLSPLREPATSDPAALIIGIGVCDLQA